MILSNPLISNLHVTRSASFARFLSALLVGCCWSTCLVAAEAEKITFNDHVQPVFREHCLACHDSGGQSGGLALDSFAAVLEGGAGGEIVSAGDGGNSRLYKLMAHIDKPIMPPGQDKLPEKQLQLVKAWIDGGLLENAGSTAMKSSKPAVEAFVPSADNRPAGEPAMPGGFYREPVIHTSRAGVVSEVAASPWAPLVAVASQRQVLLYHSQSHALLGVAPFVAGIPEVIRFSRNGDLLLVAGGRGAALGVVHLWDVKTGVRLAELGDQLDTILAADITPDHTLVALGGPRKQVRVLRSADGSEAYVLTKHTDWVTALEFSPDGKHLATADRAGNAYVWEAKTGRPVAALSGHKQIVNAVSWRGDSQVVATASDDRDFRLWKPNGQMIKQWGDYGGGVLDVAYTKDGRLVSAGRDGVAKLWNADGKEIRKLGKSSDMTMAIATVTDGSKDDALAVFGDWTGEVKLASTDSGAQVAELSANPPTLALRVAAAAKSIDKSKQAIASAEAALPKTIQSIEAAQRSVAEHESKKKDATEKLASLQTDFDKLKSEYEKHQVKVAQIDQAIQAARETQAVVQGELQDLRQQLAAVSNQEGEEADNTAANDIEAQIETTEQAAQKAQAKLVAAELPRKQAADLVAQFNRSKEERQEQVDKQRAELQAIEEAAKRLPDIKKLTAEKAALEKQLTENRKNRKQAEQRLKNLQEEQAAFAALPSTLDERFAARQEEIDGIESQLATVNQQLEDEQESVDTLKREMEELKNRLADLEKVRQQIATIADKTRASANGLKQQADEVSAEQAKIERTRSDLKAATELREKYGAE